MERDQEPGEPAPTGQRARDIPHGFHRQVRDPDRQVLHERQIRRSRARTSAVDCPRSCSSFGRTGPSVCAASHRARRGQCSRRKHPAGRHHHAEASSNASAAATMIPSPSPPAASSTHTRSTRCGDARPAACCIVERAREQTNSNASHNREIADACGSRRSSDRDTSSARAIAHRARAHRLASTHTTRACRAGSAARSNACNGSVRAAASSCGRMNRPHAPPVSGCTIASARLPTDTPVKNRNANRYDSSVCCGAAKPSQKTAQQARAAPTTGASHCRRSRQPGCHCGASPSRPPPARCGGFQAGAICAIKSAAGACWLNCNARIYATMAQRSWGRTRSAYGIHHAIAVADHLVEMAVRCVAQTIACDN